MYGLRHRRNHNRHQRRCTVKKDHHDSIRNLHDAHPERGGEGEGRERKIKLGDGRVDPKSNTPLIPSLGGRRRGGISYMTSTMYVREAFAEVTV